MATERLLAALLVGGLLSGCPRAPVAPASQRTVATVDGQAIAAVDLRRDLWRIHGKPEPGDVDRLALAEALLDQRIDQKVLANAARTAGVGVPARELDAAWEASQEGYRTEDFKSALYAQMQTPQRMKAQLEERLLTEKFLADKTRDLPRISDGEVRRFYEANRRAYNVPEQVRARQVVVRTPEEARIIADRLARGEDFAKLAREFSVAPEKERGGDLGFFPKGVMPDVFDKVCFSLETGQVSDVVTSEYGQHIFQVTERRPETAQPLEAVDAAIREQLRRAAVELEENRTLVELRNKAVVVKDREALQWAADVLAVLDGGGVK